MEPIDMRGRPRIELESQILKVYGKKYKVGDRLPTHTEAMDLFNCARNPLLRTMAILAKKGVITSLRCGGYVWGKPDEKTIARCNSEEFKRRRESAKHMRDAVSSSEGMKKACVTRAMRHDIRVQIVAAIMKEGIADHVAQALRDHDLVHLTCCEKALKLVGATFDQSDEALKQMKDAGVNPTNNLTAINFNFVPADKGPSQAIEAEIVSEEAFDGNS